MVIMTIAIVVQVQISSNNPNAVVRTMKSVVKHLHNFSKVTLIK